MRYVERFRKYRIERKPLAEYSPTTDVRGIGENISSRVTNVLYGRTKPRSRPNPQSKQSRRYVFPSCQRHPKLLDDAISLHKIKKIRPGGLLRQRKHLKIRCTMRDCPALVTATKTAERDRRPRRYVGKKVNFLLNLFVSTRCCVTVNTRSVKT